MARLQRGAALAHGQWNRQARVLCKYIGRGRSGLACMATSALLLISGSLATAAKMLGKKQEIEQVPGVSGHPILLGRILALGEGQLGVGTKLRSIELSDLLSIGPANRQLQLTSSLSSEFSASQLFSQDCLSISDATGL